MLPIGLAAPAGAYDLAPQTKLRFTVVQWMPLKGEYERWDALGGEMVVSQEGTISVPVIGTLSVVDKSPDQVAEEVANLLQTKLGLVDLPNTSVEVLEFPPVYVVGSVSTPGAFPFRPGMTVLQALALGGGRLRTDFPEISSDRIRLVSELHSAADGMLRSKARIARLLAEFSEAETIGFPPDVTASRNGSLAQEIMSQEEAIFDARANGLTRQAASLTDLGALFRAEIEALETRIVSIDESIAATETELAGVRALLEKGIATVSRRSDLERLLAGLRSDRLDQMTAILRAQQSLSEANRDAASLRDQHRTELAQDLQSEQAKLEQLTLQQTTSQRLLLQLDLDNPITASIASGQEPLLFYTIVRQDQTKIEELAAQENTVLIPGDVLRVTAPLPLSDPALPVVVDVPARDNNLAEAIADKDER